MIRLSSPLAIASDTAHFTTKWTSLIALACLTAPAATIPDASLLDRVSERAKQFWDQLSSVAITEEVLQEKLDPKGKVLLNSHNTYDYLITVRSDSSGMLVDESRIATAKKRKKAPQGTLLTTQGFAALVTIFHPQYQSSYAFTIEGEEKIDGRNLIRVSFVPRKGVPSPAVLALKGRDYPIAWEGTAWIDPQSACVTRLDVHWKDPAAELGLQSLSSEVQYAPVSFRGQSEPYWLPTTAKIDVKTLHQHWRNTHEFSKHRLFNVEAESTVGNAPAASPKTTEQQ
jgi:hypothetical protein